MKSPVAYIVCMPFLLGSCFANVGDGIGPNKIPSVNSVPKSLSLTNFGLENKTSAGFDVAFDFVGDSNLNAEVKLYFCSIKAEPACDPMAGSSVLLSANGGKYSANVTLASHGLSSGDVIKFKLQGSDPDGFSGEMKEDFLIIPYDVSQAKTISQLGYVRFGKRINASGDDKLSTTVKDIAGNIYLTGHTDGSLGEANAGGDDVFVAKLLPNGNLDTSFNTTGIKQLGNVSVGAGASGNDYVHSISLDSSGNIYLAGYTNGSLGEANAGSLDAYVAKLLPNGNLDTSFNTTGIKQFGNVSVGAGASGNDYVRSMSLDSSGNIYLAGYTNGSLGEANAGSLDAYVARLLPNGNLDTSFNTTGIKQLGNVSVGAGASGNDYVHSISLDSSGNIYLAGYTNGSLGEANAGSLDAYVAKLLPNGNLDTSFITTGIKQLGNVSVGAGASGDDFVQSISLDSSGNIYLAGHTFGSLGEANAGSRDAYVAKLLPDGDLDTSFNTTGIKQLGNVSVGAGASGNEYVQSISLDSSGNIYLAGYTLGSLGEVSAGSRDVFVAKLLPDGDLDTSFNTTGIKQLGNVSVGAGASGNDYVNSISLDSSGNIYLAGYTSGSLGEASAGGDDVFVAKLLPNGNLDTSFITTGIKQLGNVSVGAGASGDDFVQSISLDSSGNIYLAGYMTASLGEANAGSNDVFVAKLLPNGNLDTSFNTTGVRQLGNVSVGAGASGNDYVYAMSLDSSGNIYLAGYTNGSLGEANAGSFDAYVAKLLPNGNLDTSFNTTGIKQLGYVSVGAGASSTDYVYAMSLDSSGNIYLAGYTNGSLGEANAGSFDAYVAKLLPNGNLDTSFNTTGIKQLGNVSVGAGASGTEVVFTMSLDSSGNIYLAGHTNGSLGEANAGIRDVFVAKLLPDGNLDTSFIATGIKQLGNVSVGAGASGDDYVLSMSLDSSENIYLAGYTLGSLGEVSAGSLDAYVAKLLPNGNLDTSFNTTGIKQLGNVSVGAGASGDDYVQSMSLDSSGNIYLAGYTSGSLGEANAGNNDVFVAKLLPNGNLDTTLNTTGIKQFGNVSVGAGASGNDFVHSISLESSGNIYLAGYTNGGLGESNAGGYDAFVLKMGPP